MAPDAEGADDARYLGGFPEALRGFDVIVEGVASSPVGDPDLRHHPYKFIGSMLVTPGFDPSPSLDVLR